MCREHLAEVSEIEVITVEEAIEFYEGWREDLEFTGEAPVRDVESEMLGEALEASVVTNLTNVQASNANNRTC